MCVRLRARQRARSGRSRAVAPAGSRIARSRPCPHLARRPVPHDGQASSPAARLAEAAASAHNSTAGLPDHDGHDARTGHRAPGGTRVAACPAWHRPATQTGRNAGKRHHEHQPAVPAPPWPAPRRRMLTVSSRTKTDNGHRPRICMLTPDDASPLLCARKERVSRVPAGLDLAVAADHGMVPIGKRPGQPAERTAWIRRADPALQGPGADRSGTRCLDLRVGLAMARGRAAGAGNRSSRPQLAISSGTSAAQPRQACSTSRARSSGKNSSPAVASRNGMSRISSAVTAAKLPPPPRSAQNSSGS
jgi:hypothetical protein